MSDEAPEQSSKTEDPSHKKLEDARKKGDVVKSQEVTTWFMLGGTTALFGFMAPGASSGLANSLKEIFANADQFEIGGAALQAFFDGLALQLVLIVLGPLLVLSICAIAANLLQHPPLLSVEPITPKLSKISPLAGAKRLFSSEALVNFIKGLLKLSIVGVVVAVTVWPEQDRLSTLMTADPAIILGEFQEIGLKILLSVLAVVTIIAFADFLYVRQKWWKRQMMTVQETRDEYKQMEGDPAVKGRIRQLRQERGRQRMMASVPDATVIVTNPTHFAVALKYDKSMKAPLCLAKGADAIALRIREVAKEHDVPIVENPPLARALFASVEIDQPIPNEHFKAVAQVIGFVMRLRDNRGWTPGNSVN
ncbi:flagellar biosynthesis protein FlhB [Devosia algicola]|uniref:Flagellar biosynthetic protein FlhB n=1 Tax=Devosia algicola TaxID=3026418 RepID=A0ABY7YR52_9HYPH|nr:flagellar biosynthesis protein FlhB [Devosia algicola]WDR03739.1 flagellar biosynthesis protein FlhB [Devosia algicola]